mgnify:CR=1 FL=1
MRLRVAGIVEESFVDGPGIRFTVFVQGCPHRCPGCHNPQTHAYEGGFWVEVGSLLARMEENPLLDGLSLSGGEPFEQPEPLAELARLVQSRGQTVMTFTGYELDDLRSAGDLAVAALLEHTDLLVDGRFEVDRLDTARPWVGSTNQRFHALTARYAGLVDSLTALPDRLEIHVAPSGRVEVNGWSDAASLEILLEGMRRQPPSRARA